MPELCTTDAAKQAAAITVLKNKLLEMPQLEIETQHLIHGGMYARTVFIPAGTVLVGVNIRLKNICISSGDITVTTDDGIKRLTGYHVIAANHGYGRAGFAHADTYWTTFFETELNDVTVIEDAMTDESENLQTRKLNIDCAKHHIIKG